MEISLALKARQSVSGPTTGSESGIALPPSSSQFESLEDPLLILLCLKLLLLTCRMFKRPVGEARTRAIVIDAPLRGRLPDDRCGIDLPDTPNIADRHTAQHPGYTPLSCATSVDHQNKLCITLAEATAPHARANADSSSTPHPLQLQRCPNAPLQVTHYHVLNRGATNALLKCCRKVGMPCLPRKSWLALPHRP